MPSPWLRAELCVDLTPNFGVVVDFAIKAEHKTAIGRPHWLMTGGRQVDNCQPPMAEANSRTFIDPHTFIIRPAMAQPIGHRFQHGRCDRP